MTVKIYKTDGSFYYQWLDRDEVRMLPRITKQYTSLTKVGLIKGFSISR
jgi:hypothetical protein